MLILISQIRRKLLWLWIGFSIPVVLLVFVQTIAGKYTEIVSTPWLWLAINLLPGFGVLLVGALQNKNAGKFIQKYIYRIIFVSVVIYLLLILLTLFSMTAASAEQSLAAYFMQSYQWLLPFQLLLLGVFALLYFRKDAVFQPNEKIIKEHVVKEMEKAKTKNNLVQQKAFELLVSSDYSGLFSQLKKSFEQGDREKYQQLVMLQTQYNQWEEQTGLGLISQKDAQLTVNRISMALIRLIKYL